MTQTQKKEQLLADAFELLDDVAHSLALFNGQRYHQLRARYNDLLQAEAIRQKQWNEFYDAGRDRVVSKLNNNSNGKT